MPRELIPIALFNILGLVAIAFSPIGKAIARRIGGKETESGDLEDVRAELTELRERLADTEARLGGEMDEVHNRLDFAERVIGQQKPGHALPGGG